jgi:hypothetical protein
MTLTHSTYGGEEMRIEFWWGKFKRLLRTPRHKWEDNFKMSLKERRQRRGLNLPGLG